MVTILNPGDPITPEQLNAFEERLNLTLPEDYRTFLLTYNGGRPKEAAFDFTRNGRKDGSWIGRLRGLTEKRGANLEQMYGYSRGFVAAHFFPIAPDAGKHALYLSLGQEDYGAVYFGDTDEVSEDGINTMYFVAPSFTAFMNSLFDDSIPPTK